MRINFLKYYLIIVFFITVYPIKSVYGDTEPPFELPPQSEINKLKLATIFTNKGAIDIRLYPNEAPWHVANLKFLADKGYYKNTSFHLFYPDYIIQGGDPSKSGKGGPGYTLPPEFNERKHLAGTFGMARVKGPKNPERRSNGGQFHILINDDPRMDGQYTIMGEVIRGMEVVRELRKGDLIEDLIVYVRD